MIKQFRKTSLYRFLFNTQNFFNYMIARINPRRTYAQYEEDVALEMLLGKVDKFIDIGAYDGYSCSNTFLFSIKGSGGLCFEPVRFNYNRLKWLYATDKKIKCFNFGISSKEETLEIINDGILSAIEATEDKEHIKIVPHLNHKTEVIKVKALDSVLTENKLFYDSDFVSIDVEGHELSVLQGIDFSKFRTNCFVIETHWKGDPAPWLHKDYDEIDRLLKSKGYIAAFTSPLNTFWVHSQYPENGKIGKIISDLKGYSLLKN